MHPTDADRADDALPVLEALIRAACAGDFDQVGACYDDDVAWLEETGVGRGRAAAVARHRHIAARATEWEPPQQQGAKAVLRWIRRGLGGAVQARGAIVVEVRRGRIVFAAEA